VIVDLGSNIGGHALYLAIWSKARNVRKVHAFRPVPVTFQILARNVAISNWHKTMTALKITAREVKQNAELSLNVR
jgi:FkbM family methyltransferase